MQRAAVAVRDRSRQLTAQQFSVLDMLGGFGLVAHHEYPRMAAWWQRAVCGRLIGPEQATPAACERLMQQVAAAIENELAEPYRHRALLYRGQLDKAAS